MVIGGKGSGYNFYDSDTSLSIACISSVLFIEITPSVQNVLSHPYMSWLGDVSYGLYLSHSIILSTVGSVVVVALHNWGLSHTVKAIAYIVICYVFSVILGWVFYRVFEIPTANFAVKLRQKLFFAGEKKDLLIDLGSKLDKEQLVGELPPFFDPLLKTYDHGTGTGTLKDSDDCCTLDGLPPCPDTIIASSEYSSRLEVDRTIVATNNGYF